MNRQNSVSKEIDNIEIRKANVFPKIKVVRLFERCLNIE